MSVWAAMGRFPDACTEDLAWRSIILTISTWNNQLIFYKIILDISFRNFKVTDAEFLM